MCALTHLLAQLRGQFTIQGMPNWSTHMPKPLEKKVLPNGMLTLPPSASALKLALGVGGILDLQRDRKALRLLEMAGRRVGGHQHLAVDREPACMIFFL